MEWSIQELARRSGVTSRTLRHYDREGLLAPTRVGTNGWRWYDAAAGVRLQRILLLRGLGVGLADIRRMLDDSDPAAALREHLVALNDERALLERRIASIGRTLDALERGEDPMQTDMFDGFDHAAHRDEVVTRWGADAWSDGDTWWRGLGEEGRAAFRAEQDALAREWADAAARAADPAGAEAQALAQRHVELLAGVPGTPGYPDGPTPEYLGGLGELYAADPRYGYSADAASLVRDALAVFARR